VTAGGEGAGGSTAAGATAERRARSVAQMLSSCDVTLALAAANAAAASDSCAAVRRPDQRAASALALARKGACLTSYL